MTWWRCGEGGVNDGIFTAARSHGVFQQSAREAPEQGWATWPCRAFFLPFVLLLFPRFIYFYKTSGAGATPASYRYKSRKVGREKTKAHLKKQRVYHTLADIKIYIPVWCKTLLPSLSLTTFARSPAVSHASSLYPTPTPIFLVRQVLLGDMGAGKSSLVLRFVKGQFFDYQESTIGAF